MKTKFTMAIATLALLLGFLGSINTSEAAFSLPVPHGESITFEPGECNPLQRGMAGFEMVSNPGSAETGQIATSAIQVYGLGPEGLSEDPESHLATCPEPPGGIGVRVCGFIYITNQPGFFVPTNILNQVHQMFGINPELWGQDHQWFHVGDLPMAVCFFEQEPPGQPFLEPYGEGLTLAITKDVPAYEAITQAEWDTAFKALGNTEVTRKVDATNYPAQLGGSLREDPTDHATGFTLTATRPLGGDGEVLNNTDFQVDYDPACVTITDVRLVGGDSHAFNINNVTGVATASVTNGTGGYEMVHFITDLVGSVTDICQVDILLTDVKNELDLDVPINPLPSSFLNLQRGNANTSDDVVNALDTQWIAEYRAGTRPACTITISPDCVHTTNVGGAKKDIGSGDVWTLSDDVYIEQYVAGSRDVNFVPNFNTVVIDGDTDLQSRPDTGHRARITMQCGTDTYEEIPALDGTWSFPQIPAGTTCQITGTARGALTATGQMLGKLLDFTYPSNQLLSGDVNQNGVVDAPGFFGISMDVMQQTIYWLETPVDCEFNGMVIDQNCDGFMTSADTTAVVINYGKGVQPFP